PRPGPHPARPRPRRPRHPLRPRPRLRPRPHLRRLPPAGAGTGPCRPVARLLAPRLPRPGRRHLAGPPALRRRVGGGRAGAAGGPAGTSLREIAARCASLPVTALVGPAARVARFLDLVRGEAGGTLPRAWHGLAAVLVGGPDAPALARVRQDVGPGPVV